MIPIHLRAKSWALSLWTGALGGILLGLLGGGALILAIGDTPPVTIREAREIDGVAFRGGRLDLLQTIDRTRDCAVSTSRYLWRWIDVDGERVLIARLADGTCAAIGGLCSHQVAYLEDGVLEGNTVLCPRHGAAFALTTGEPLSAPADMPECRAIHPTWRPMTSATMHRWWDSPVVRSRSMASVAMDTAVSKPKV